MSSSSPPVPSSPAGSPRARPTGLLQITATALLWGTTGVVVALLSARSSVSAVDVAFLRLAVATAVLVPVALLRPARRRDLLRRPPAALLLVGVGLACYQVLYFLAVTLAGVGLATVVSLGLAPVALAAWEAVRARRRPSASALAVIATSVAGLALVTAGAPEASSAAPRPMLGVGVAVASGVVYAASTAAGRHLSATTTPTTLVTATTVVGAVVLAPPALVGGLPVPLQLVPVALVAYLGVVTTAVAYGLFYAGLRTTPGSTAAVVTLLEPLTAVVLGVVVLAEPLPAGTVAGGALLLGAVAALYLRPEPVPPVSPGGGPTTPVA